MLVIFDWDGTLADSASKIVACLAAASNDCGLPLLADEQYQHIIGLGLPEAMVTLYPNADVGTREALLQAYVDHFLSDASPTQLFNGVPEGLQSLREQGYCLAVATGKSRRGMDRVLAELGMHDFFDITRCADETLSKPDPLMLSEILASTGFTAEQSVLVGDTSYDLEMAINANMRSVGVSYGAHSQAILKAHQPLAIAHGFGEVLALVSKALPTPK